MQLYKNYVQKLYSHHEDKFECRKTAVVKIYYMSLFQKRDEIINGKLYKAVPSGYIRTKKDN